MFHFKLRVLDLLDTFLKVSIAKPIVVDAIGPLLELLKDNSNSDQNKILYNKVSGIITNRFKVPKELPILPDTDVALELLSKIHEICSKNLDVSTSNQFSIVCVFLAKSILHSDTQKNGVPSKAKKSRKESVKVQNY